MSYAGTYPDRVERTVLNDIGPDIDPRGGARIANTTRDAVTTFKTMEEVIAWHCEQRVGFGSLSDAEQRTMAGYAVKALSDGGYTWKMDPAVRTDPRRPDPETSWKLGPPNPRVGPPGTGRGERPAIAGDGPAHGGGDAGLSHGGGARRGSCSHTVGTGGLWTDYGVFLFGLM